MVFKRITVVEKFFVLSMQDLDVSNFVSDQAKLIINNITFVTMSVSN